jgi:protoheme IX farnesyltransferase
VYLMALFAFLLFDHWLVEPMVQQSVLLRQVI